MYQTLSLHSDWVKGLACDTMVLSLFLIKRKSSAGTSCVRKYIQPLLVSYVTLSIQLELPGHLYGHDFSYRPHNHTTAAKLK